jgi:gamma-glutamyltranspeptidase/glutathione hydrolase
MRPWPGLFIICLGLGVAFGLPAAGEPAQARHHMIIAAEPLAAEAGRDVLRAGGSAVDAAIAAQAVLALVEPQASGLGGGAVMLHYAAASGKVTAWDGRETAPAAAGSDLFLAADGRPMGFHAAGVGGRAVGVPGALSMLEAAHRAYGRLPWAQLFASAIGLAEQGFAVPPRLSAAIAADAQRLGSRPAARAYFFHPDGTPLQAGETLVNRPLAEALGAVAAGGAAALQRGALAVAIATAVRTDANPGLLTADDLAAYAPKQREPVCGPYRAWRVCGMGPPSSGGTTVLETLGLLAHLDIPGLAHDAGTPGVDAAHLIVEAERLARADRALYLADSDFVGLPLPGLLAADYLTARAQLIDRDRAMASVRAGNPDWPAPELAPAPPQPEHGTSQISVVDDDGNAVSLTTTVQDVFGSRLLVSGFLLNNELTDFSLVPSVDGRAVANRVEPGKRPLSSMAPTLVFDRTGRLRFVLGSVGGARIIGDVTQALVELLDWGVDPATAAAAPHVSTLDDKADLEAGTPLAALAPALAARGQTVRSYTSISGLAIIALTPEGFAGGADPRREGVAAGD